MAITSALNSFLKLRDVCICPRNGDLIQNNAERSSAGQNQTVVLETVREAQVQFNIFVGISHADRAGLDKALKGEHTEQRFPIQNILGLCYTLSLSVCVCVCVSVSVSVSVYCRVTEYRPVATSLTPPRVVCQQADCADPIRNAYEQMAGGPWDIPRSSLVLTTQLLGNGHFGQVKKGFVRMRGAKVPVAIKSLKGEKLLCIRVS